MARQGDLLERLEPGPTLTLAMRQTVIPRLAALLLEAVTNPTEERTDGMTTAKEADDEQDRA